MHSSFAHGPNLRLSFVVANWRNTERTWTIVQRADPPFADGKPSVIPLGRDSLGRFLSCRHGLLLVTTVSQRPAWLGVYRLFPEVTHCALSWRMSACGRPAAGL